MSVSELTEGLKKKVTSLDIVNPSVKPSVCQLPVRGAFLCALHPLPLTLPQGRISHAIRRISHGGAIFHIAIAIFHCA